MLRYILLSGCGTFLMGCTSVQASPDLNYPLTTIYSAVETVLSMGIANTSENHRELYSRPFIIKQDPELKAEGFRDRGVASVTILGDQRPYTIEVTVSIERGKISNPKEREPTEYSYDHHDKKLAKRLLDRIMAALDKRLHEDNVIDDFKAF